MANKGLVTGFRGTPHIDADDIASFNTGVVGPGDYVLNTRDGLRGTMSSANTFVLASGDLIMQGRHVTFPTPTSATVESGAQGMKRNDLAVCRYTKATNGVENAELKILKGTSTQNSPADPAYENGRIIEGSTIVDMPLYRIPVTGITVGEPVPLYDKLPSMWDSVTHTLAGKKTLTFDGGDSSRLFDGPQFKALAGRPFDPDRDFVSVMLSNRADDSSTSAIGCEYLPKANWVTVRMNKPINAGAMIDISYLIVLGR